MQNKLKRYDGIDFMKLIMAISVVGIHSGLYGLKTFGRLAVPFFLITSSYFFFQKYYYRDAGLNYLKKYLKRIALLYLSWQVIFLPLLILQFREDLQGEFTIKRIIVQIIELVTSGAHNGWGQSWYLLALIYGLPTLLVLLKLLPKWGVWLLVIGFECYFILTTGYNMFYPNHWIMISPLTMPRVLIYLMMGCELAGLAQKPKFWLISQKALYASGMCLLVLFFAENLINERLLASMTNPEEVILTLPTSTMIFIASLLITQKLNYSHFYKEFSTFLYVTHKAVISIVVRGHLISEDHKVQIFMVALVGSLIGYVLYSYLRKKTEWKWLGNLV
ncbi:acyltransferase family protein [Streptococcus orisasini]